MKILAVYVDLIDIYPYYKLYPLEIYHRLPVLINCLTINLNINANEMFTQLINKFMS